jgi:hypothetical protein
VPLRHSVFFFFKRLPFTMRYNLTKGSKITVIHEMAQKVKIKGFENSMGLEFLPMFSLLVGTTRFLALRTTTVSRSADGR